MNEQLNFNETINNNEKDIKEIELNPNQEVSIENNLLSSREKTMDDFGVGADVLAQVEAGRKKFYILETSNAGDDPIYKGVLGFKVAAKRMNPGYANGIYQMQPKKYDSDRLLVNEDFFASNGYVGYVGIKNGEDVVVGRNHETENFKCDKTVSRDHFMVKTGEDGSISIKNLNPTNPTVLTTREI
jgi:hypothetical protein